MSVLGAWVVQSTVAPGLVAVAEYVMLRSDGVSANACIKMCTPHKAAVVAT
jgi:hypothetical protein